MPEQVTPSVSRHVVAAAGQPTVAVIRIDNPPVNALSPDVLEGLERAVATANADLATDALVVIGAGRTFVAGADIKGLEQLVWGAQGGAPDMHDRLRQVEECRVPVVMALHGTALGGGLELAMAGHYRVALASAQLGQPEVNLGIIPGAEGTQRLPRLVGIEAAIRLCVSGKPIKASEALSLGLLDRVVEGDLELAAVTFARECVMQGGHPLKTRDKSERLQCGRPLAELVAAGLDLARRTRRHETAPLRAVAAIEAAARLPFEEGCRRERELFLECAASDQAKALIHAFFAERGVAKVPGIDRDTAVRAVTTVAIVGAGTMGGGIAMACANAGLPVILSDTDSAALDRGMATIRRNYQISVSRGRSTPALVEERLGRIRPQTGYTGFEQADLIVEAVFENLTLKTEVLGALDAIARPGCVLATNTSTLDIDVLAGATNRPQDVIGLHFFSPANVMRLVEIVRGARTSAGTVATALALAKRLGKVGVVVNNGPGFVGNRMMFPYMYEAQFLVEDGATPAQVDAALTDWGMAMGIFAVDDMAGLDVAWRVREELGQFTEPGARKPLVSEALVRLGRLGQKAGAGWYRYDGDRTPISDPDVVALIERTTREAGIARRPIGTDEILERTLYALINEGARVLDGGFALRAADIDVIYLNGYGFPSFRGGPMFFADTVGLAAIHDRVTAFHRDLGARWEPAPLLARLAAEGRTFRQFDAERAGVQPSARVPSAAPLSATTAAGLDAGSGTTAIPPWRGN
jgi:3-hydroxyacyl-CoA dehydrogenase